MWTIERLFSDNNHYNDFDKLPSIDALAHAMTWLFSDKAEGANDGEDYNMKYRIKLHDLMTISCYFIIASTYEFGEITIQGYIVEMKKDKRGSLYSGMFENEDDIDYSRKGYMSISSASKEVVEATLWASYVYTTTMSNYDSSRKGIWEKAAKLLLQLLREETYLNAQAFAHHHLVKNAQHAVDVMMQHLLKMETIRAKKHDKNDDNKAATNGDREQLVKENEKLMKQLHDMQTIPEDIPAQQKVRMELTCRLLEKAGVTEDVLKCRGNKDKAGTIMGTLLGIPAKTCKQYLSDRVLNRGYHKETINNVNPLLKDLKTEIQL